MFQISRGKIITAKKCVIYGPEGIGKSTFASKFPNPLFIDVEGSTKALDVARVDNIPSWNTIKFILQDLIEDQQGFKTIVIDTADWAERLCINFVCQQEQKQGIEDFGYGKGYVYLKEEFSKLLFLCDELIQKGVTIVFTAHAIMRKFEQPDERGSYDRWELKLSKFDAPMLKEWSDLLLFCNYKTFTTKQPNGTFKVSGGKRTVYTTHNPCWDAKNRYDLPDEIDMEFSEIEKIININTADIICEKCGKIINNYQNWTAIQIATQTKSKFGKTLCFECARNEAEKIRTEQTIKQQSQEIKQSQDTQAPEIK